MAREELTFRVINQLLKTMKTNQYLFVLLAVATTLGSTQAMATAQAEPQPIGEQFTARQTRYSANDLGPTLEVNPEVQVDVLPEANQPSRSGQISLEDSNLRPAFYGLFRRPYDEPIELLEIRVD